MNKITSITERLGCCLQDCAHELCTIDLCTTSHEQQEDLRQQAREMAAREGWLVYRHKSRSETEALQHGLPGCALVCPQCAERGRRVTHEAFVLVQMDAAQPASVESPRWASCTGTSEVAQLESELVGAVVEMVESECAALDWKAKAEEYKTRLDEALGLLSDMAWGLPQLFDRRCRRCFAFKEEGHKPGCDVDRILKGSDRCP